MKSNPAMKVIPFRHAYHKLANKDFTTIRGKALSKQVKAGDVVLCTTKTGDFRATIMFVQLQMIRSMSDEFLEKDASYPGHPVSTREQFVELVNSFRPKHWGPQARVTLDTEMTVLHLRKL